MTQSLPEPRPSAEVYPAGQRLPAHHRPPSIEYRDGVPYHYTVGQPPAPQQIVVQLPEQQGMSQAQREFMLTVVMWLVVAVVLCACVCAVVILCGGTLMGIIGTIAAAVSTAAVPVGITLVGAIVAAGWAASKFKSASKTNKTKGK